MEHLLPLAEDALELDIRLVAVGTGRVEADGIGRCRRGFGSRYGG